MTGAGSNIDLFTNRDSLGDRDIEAGRSSMHLSDNEKMTLTSESLPEDISYIRNTEEEHDELDRWVDSLSQILEDVPQYMCIPGHPGRISKIPANLREIDAKAYEPYVVSIGPYHHGKAKLLQSEKRKKLVLRYILENRSELTLKDYLEEIKSAESEARSFYSEVEMDSAEFAQMLLLDSIYVITTFCGVPQRQERSSHRSTRIESGVGNEDTSERINYLEEDIGSGDGNENLRIIARTDESNDQTRSGDNDSARFFSPLFEHDFLLLENQLPFFVLQKMYALLFGDSGTEFIDIMKDRLSILLSGYTKLGSEKVTSPKEEVHHLLHLCHLFFRPTLQQKSTSCQLLESSQLFGLGNAVQLYEAGVTFEARSWLTEHCLLDITFGSSGEMVMPCLDVDGNTNSLLRNLIALEQMKYPNMGLHVSAYAVLLLHLMTIPQDVELLRRKGIIKHHLASDKEMMCLVNRLSVGLSFDYVEDMYSLKPLFHELKRYSKHRVPRWKAWLKHRHFSNPWTMISLMVGSIFLLLSVVQTYYTVYSYYYPCLDCQ